MRTSPPRWRNYGSNDGRARISSFAGEFRDAGKAYALAASTRPRVVPDMYGPDGAASAEAILLAGQPDVIMRRGYRATAATSGCHHT